MKQKQVKASPKFAKQIKSAKKATPAKKARMEVEESDDEEEVEQKIVAKKPWVKKPVKVQEIVAEESSDEEDQEEDDENEDQEDNEQDDEVEEDEEASEEEGDEEDEEHEQDEDEEEDDDDEAPSEEAIDKEEPTIPSQVKSGPIAPTVPSDRVIHVTKIPKQCKKMNIIEAFAKYGAIEQVHILTTTGGTVADIAFKTEKAALAASADNKKVNVLGSIVVIKIKKEKNFNDRDRSVYVQNIKTGTGEEELRQHFEPCGEIEKVRLITTREEKKFAFIVFTDKSAIPTALKLHNSVLNGVNIRVAANTEKQTITRPSAEEGLTVLVKNTQNFESIDVAKLETIFSKCGEIANLDVVCKKYVLAFITFKTEKAVEKALALSGKTEEEIELDLEIYDPNKKRTSIHVSNLPRDCTEEDLTNIFSKAGEIVSIALKNGHAKICFTDCEGYCKSFLYNETFIRGKFIFIEPFSFRKSIAFKHKPFQKRSFKRPAQNGYSVFKPKKSKTF